MRLDLTTPIDVLRRRAISDITRCARDAHRAHEDGGGYEMVHALDLAEVEGSPYQHAAQASLDFHRSIQDARRRAITAINSAPHGTAISAAVATFHQEVSL
jgi:hypothetical protein